LLTLTVETATAFTPKTPNVYPENEQVRIDQADHDFKASPLLSPT
jgi:hypothetical protein